MAFFPPNRTSDPDEEECSFLSESVWRKSFLTDDTRRNLVALTSVISIAILPTILLNALVIIAVATRHQLRTPSNILLASMAGTDLFTGLIVQPIVVAVHVKRILSDGPFCILETVYEQLVLVSSITSFSHLVLIGINRFIAVKKPLRYQIIVTRQRVKIGVILAWAFTFCLRIPHLILFGIDSKQVVYFYKKVMGVIFSIFGTLYIVVIVYMYGYIYSESRRQKKRLKNEQLTQEEARKVKKDNKANNTATIILGVLLLTYLPSIIWTAVIASSDYLLEPRSMTIVLGWTDTFVMLGSLSNPLIYGWRFKKLRRAFLEILRLREPENRPPKIEMAVIRRHRPEVPPSTAEAFSLPAVRQDPVLLSFRHLDADDRIVPAEESNPLF